MGVSFVASAPPPAGRKIHGWGPARDAKATDEPDHSASATQPGRDDRPDPGFDEVALYGVVRKAVEDAILGAVGTLLLVGVAFVLVLVGASAAIRSPGLLGVMFGGGALVVGLYLGATTLELIPPAREWF